MATIKTHTGLITHKNGIRRVRLYETSTSWCVNHRKCYSKITGRRSGNSNSLSRLQLDSITPIELEKEITE
ncbi:hypothetical protein GA350_20815 [Escherichia coli]|nr:hypothetical protein [Escherichia coli]EFE8157938.1 hypothetical protein [Escherichia coli]EFH9434460.1 hypothetical protein [Escherichia coli]EFN7451550.1 hypothetical protein [Escherichia coli]EFN7470538.1 hypothetical protein [Escherichia coli]